MSTVLEERSLPRAQPRWGAWIAILAGLAFLYVPTYIDLARGLWRDDAYAHGPIILAVFAFLVWRSRDALGTDHGFPPDGKRWSVPGFLLLLFGLVLYVVGRSQALAVFEVASHIPVIAGVLLMARGPRALRRLGFALAFLFFLIPLPGFILDTVTVPLKSVVSALVEGLLRLGGYPVERSGVVLAVGPHEMLVADACSGLNSLYSLFALGLLYAHLTGPSSRARLASIVLSIVPIAIAANVVRVLALVLITYHVGEKAASGFLHGFAGMTVFVVALAMLIGVDRVFHQVLGTRYEVRGKPNSVSTSHLAPRTSHLSNWGTAACVSMMLIAAIAVPLLKPVRAEGPAIDLEKIVPVTFGDWHIDPEMVPIAPAPDVQAKLDRIYNQVVSRTYVNAQGERVMLTVAHGGDQSDALKAHRQEACYAAQGFAIHDLAHGSLAVGGRTLPVTRMVATRADRVEPVTYWFTMGDRVVLGRFERLRAQLSSGLAGRMPDGMLVRVSSISNEPARAFAAQQAFAAALFSTMSPGEAARFLGADRG